MAVERRVAFKGARVRTDAGTAGGGALECFSRPVVLWPVNIDDYEFRPVLSAVLCRPGRTFRGRSGGNEFGPGATFGPFYENQGTSVVPAFHC